MTLTATTLKRPLSTTNKHHTSLDIVNGKYIRQAYHDPVAPSNSSSFSSHDEFDNTPLPTISNISNNIFYGHEITVRQSDIFSINSTMTKEEMYEETVFELRSQVEMLSRRLDDSSMHLLQMARDIRSVLEHNKKITKDWESIKEHMGIIEKAGKECNVGGDGIPMMSQSQKSMSANDGEKVTSGSRHRSCRLLSEAA